MITLIELSVMPWALGWLIYDNWGNDSSDTDVNSNTMLETASDTTSEQVLGSTANETSTNNTSNDNSPPVDGGDIVDTSTADEAYTTTNNDNILYASSGAAYNDLSFYETGDNDDIVLADPNEPDLYDMGAIISNANIATNGGNDTFATNYSGGLNLDTGSGDDTVTGAIMEDALIDLGEGNDEATIDIGFFVTINGGAGDDRITFGTDEGNHFPNSDAGGYAEINGGDGNDVIKASISYGDAPHSISGGNGDDDIMFASNRYSELTIDGGTGADTYSFFSDEDNILYHSDGDLIGENLSGEIAHIRDFEPGIDKIIIDDTLQDGAIYTGHTIDEELWGQTFLSIQYDGVSSFEGIDVDYTYTLKISFGDEHPEDGDILVGASSAV